MKRYLKLLGIFLISFIALFAFGCEVNPGNNPEPGGDEPAEEVVAPTELEVYNVDGKRVNTYYYGETIELAVDVDPSDASYDVIWTSSDDSIASVDANGLVRIVGTGEFTITATSKHDENVSASWSRKAYDNRADLSKIKDAKDYLNVLFPDGYAVSGYVTLPESFGDAIITWQSSNSQVMDSKGLYTRQNTDVTVTMTAKISAGRTIDTWSKEFLVGNINDVEMKPLNSGKLVMMYAYSKGSAYTQYELEHVDIINHAFALINTSTHKLELGSIERSVSTIIKARSYGIRVCLSIGGWGADGFSQACSSAENRAIFIASIVEAVNRFGYDGVDLDWEYPGSGSAGIKYLSADKANFTALVKELRGELNKIRPGLLLTIAVASDTTYYDVKTVNNYVDYWNIMTYDFSSKSAGSRAVYDEPLTRTKESINSYIRAGASANKVVLGITFRAVKFKVSDLGDSYGIGKTMEANRIDVDYADLVKDYYGNAKYQFAYDSTNGMGVCFSTARIDGYYEVLAFNDVRTMNAKAQYVATTGLAGIMAWELGMDSKENNILKMTVNALNK